MREAMLALGKPARRPQRALALASTAQKNAALKAMAKAIRARPAAIIAADNAADVARAQSQGPEGLASSTA